jgi:hypothetical protein
MRGRQGWRLLFCAEEEMLKKWILMAAAAMGMAGAAGCVQGDAVKAASTIHAYVPVVIGLANDVMAIAEGLDATEATKIQALGTKVQSELKELESVSGAYAAAPSSDGWSALQAVVDQLVSDADGGLLSALAIKDAASQQKAKVVLSALDAAIHVVDGYLTAARGTAETKAAATERTVKLQSVVRYWSPADWQRVEKASGGRGSEMVQAEMSLGF